LPKLNLTFRAGISQEIGPGTGGIAIGSFQEIQDILPDSAIVMCRRGWRRKDKIVKDTVDKEVM
jgi:hypothetical protein